MVCMVQIQALLQYTMNTVILGIRQSNVTPCYLGIAQYFRGVYVTELYKWALSLKQAYIQLGYTGPACT